MINGVCDKCGAYMAVTGDPALVLCQCGNIMHDRQVKHGLSVRYVGEYFGSDEHMEAMSSEIEKQRATMDRLAFYLGYTLDIIANDTVARSVRARTEKRAQRALDAYKRMLEDEE